MRNRIFSAFFLAIVIGASVFVTSAQDLPAGNWKLTAYNFRQKIAYPISDKLITLNIDPDGKIGGRSGCNVYGGSYSFEGGNLAISDIFSTMMACDEPLMSFERTYYDVLRDSDNFTFESGTLTIMDSKTKSFVRFERENKPKPRNKC
jgi:heat shock protein HslJ